VNELRLNPDCVRDILLSVEEICDYHNVFDYYENNTEFNLANYSHEEIIYHIKQCELSGLIMNVRYYDGATHISIGDLTPSGHQFLANIRKDTVWNGVKSVAEKVGSTSLSVLTQIAANVVTELIKAQFGLTP
jgi:hypothetical protein